MMKPPPAPEVPMLVPRHPHARSALRGVPPSLCSLLLALLCAGCPSELPDDDDTPVGPVGGGIEVASPKRNIVMISVDTARRDYFGRYGGGATTPFLDTLMEESLVMDAFQSSGAFTAPAFFSVFAARTPIDMGFIVAEGSAGISTPELDQLQWGPGYLQAAGFWTAMVNSNPLLDAYYADLVHRNDAYEYAVPLPTRPSVFAEASEVTDTGLELGQQCVDQSRPCIVHVHYMDTHLPLAPPQQDLDALGFGDPPPVDITKFIDVTLFITQSNGLIEINEGMAALSTQERADAELWMRRYYAASMHFVDREIERLWAGLDAMGLLDDTLVVFFTDHGERLGEDGLWGHGTRTSAIEQDNVGFFWARDIEAGAHPHPSGLVDLLPTMTDPAVVDFTEPAGWGAFTTTQTGMPLGTALADRPVFAYASFGAGAEGNISVRVGDRTLVYTWNGGIEFFHDDVDPVERNNVFDPDDPEVQALWALMRADIPRVRAAVPDLPPPNAPFGLSL